MPPNNVIPPLNWPFARSFYSGDIIRVTSLRNRDITWIAEVMSCKHSAPAGQTLYGPEMRCNIKWISGEGDDDNFKRYYNSYGVTDPDKCLDHVDTTDPRLHIQLYDRTPDRR